MKKPIIYQMLPRLWGEGKFSSVDDATLDYLSELGMSHVWYTGIPRHSTGESFVKGDPGSPYSISDYYDVNPYMADVEADRMSEFENLVKRTHRHGLKLIIDFVPNHVARNYSDAHGGVPHFDFSDYDWTDTYKINYSHPDTWGRLLDIIKFWLGKGVDGFRCDMVEMVPPEFFKWLIAEAKGVKAETIFIAEVYTKERYWQYIKEIGFDYLYDKSGLYDVLRAIASGNADARGITWNWQFLNDLQPNMLNFLENHDEQRIASTWFTGKRRNDAYLYTSLLLNTAPFMLYFGGEIGADAIEGHEGRTSIFNWCKPEELRVLWNHVHGISDLKPEQKEILESYKSAFAMAKGCAVQEGLTYDLCYCQDTNKGFNPDKHFVFIRKSIGKTKKLGNGTFLLLANFDKDSEGISQTIGITIPEHAVEYLEIPASKKLSGKTIMVESAPGSCQVIKL